MLKLTLKPGERVIINGAVIHAGGATQIFVENRAAILRESEVIQPDAATTPARALYVALMLAYVDPAQEQQHQRSIVAALGVLLDGQGDAQIHALAAAVARHAAAHDYYRAMARCRRLIARESEIDACGLAA